MASICLQCVGPLITNDGISMICPTCTADNMIGSQTPITPEQAQNETPDISDLLASQGSTNPSQSGRGDDAMCIPGCTRGTDKRLAVIRCLWCRGQFHKTCVGSESYVCHGCHKMPTKMNEMFDMMTMMMASVKTLLTDNKTLKEIVSTQSQAINRLEGQTSSNPSATHGLVTGSSVLRDIDPDKLVKTQVKSISGGRIRDVRNILTKDATRYTSVTVVVGGNDCGARTDQEPVENLADSFRELIKEAKQVAPKVRIGSILPRGPNADVGTNDRIEVLNAAIIGICSDENVEFVNNDEVFKLRNGSQNTGYFIKDLTHPNDEGTLSLSTSLGLNIMPQHSHDVSRRRTYAGATKRTHNHQKTAHQAKSAEPRTTDHRRTRSNTHSAPRTHTGRASQGPQRYSNDWQNAWHDDDRGEWETVRRRDRRHDDYRESGHTDSHSSHCEYCYEKNHNKNTCRHGKPIRCDSCHGLGHKSKHHH